MNNQIYTINAIHDVQDSFIPTDDQKCAGIPKSITMCVNARVMLIRNIDTQNGLVNGAQGTVHSIEWDYSSTYDKDSTDKMPRCVNVIFDDAKTMSPITNISNKPIGIKPISVNFLGNDHRYITRTQIPLVLSFATTVHKVQGLTLKQAVCDIGPSIFQGGIAYVVLSRVTTISDLFIKRLCPPRIYPAKNVISEMERLRQHTSRTL